MQALFSNENLSFFSIADFKQKFGITAIAIGHDQDADDTDVYTSGAYQGQRRIWASVQRFNGQTAILLVTGSFIEKMNQGGEALVMCETGKGDSINDYIINAQLRKPKNIQAQFTL